MSKSSITSLFFHCETSLAGEVYLGELLTGRAQSNCHGILYSWGVLLVLSGIVLTVVCQLFTSAWRVDCVRYTVYNMYIIYIYTHIAYLYTYYRSLYILYIKEVRSRQCFLLAHNWRSAAPRPHNWRIGSSAERFQAFGPGEKHRWFCSVISTRWKPWTIETNDFPSYLKPLNLRFFIMDFPQLC